MATPASLNLFGIVGWLNIALEEDLQIARSAIPAMSHVGRLVCFGIKLPTPAAAQPRGSWSSVSPTHGPCRSEAHERTTHALMADFATGPPPEPAGEPREKRSGNASCSSAVRTCVQATSAARRSSLTQSPPPLLPHQHTDGSKRGYVIQQDDSASRVCFDHSLSRPDDGVQRLRHSTLQTTV